MDASLSRALCDKTYERRKSAALELEKVVRDAAQADDHKKLNTILAQLCELAASQNANTRAGSIMGLAGVSIALGTNIAQYLGAIVPPILSCFTDGDSKVRYFACESMYNVAKVAKGEILVFFNELFDCMSKLVADGELPVKNGAELLDRLIKDIVTEQASTYVSRVEPERPPSSASMQDKAQQPPPKAFSLPRFIPLLKERVYVLNPFTRNYLVSWLMVLDSVPELELVSFLPEFLDGLLKYLSDPTVDIRIATQTLLADFLREIRAVAEVNAALERGRLSREAAKQAAIKIESEAEVTGEQAAVESDETQTPQEEPTEDEGDGTWVPGQGVIVDHAAIVETLLQHLSFPDEEIQATCLRWIAEFLAFAQDVMMPFTPSLLPVILSSLAHHVPTIRSAANETNWSLYRVIESLPEPTTETAPSRRGRTLTSSPPLNGSAFPVASSGPSSRVPSTERHPKQDTAQQIETVLEQDREAKLAETANDSAISDERASISFDIGATVNALTLQFLSEHEETRVAAIQWLIMLHRKGRSRILAIDETAAGPSTKRRFDSSTSGLSIALLLKMLSDPSEKVLRYDLQLLSQISLSSQEDYFPSFLHDLLSLFSTDRKLLETRGSLIIRHLCGSLNSERIYRTFAELLERDEDLEFASVMVQNLSLIMITSPELADLRKRLRALDTKDGQALFTAMFRSWSHNAVATFTLCLLAQAYEQACALLQIFADLEITVGLLIQIDKLVQLLESPVFTSLRLQLLEPDRHPFLLKALYGLLMLLPQSSAFATLRNRLSAVSSLGYLQTVPRQFSSSSTASSTGAGGVSGRSTLRRGDEIPWTQLVTHFRSVQKRRAAMAAHAAEGGASTTTSPGPAHETVLSTGARSTASNATDATSRSNALSKRVRSSGAGMTGTGLGILTNATSGPRTGGSARSSMTGGSVPPPSSMTRPMSPIQQNVVVPPPPASSSRETAATAKRRLSVPASTSRK